MAKKYIIASFLLDQVLADCLCPDHLDENSFWQRLSYALILCICAFAWDRSHAQPKPTPDVGNAESPRDCVEQSEPGRPVTDNGPETVNEEVEEPETPKDESRELEITSTEVLTIEATVEEGEKRTLDLTTYIVEETIFPCRNKRSHSEPDTKQKRLALLSTGSCGERTPEFSPVMSPEMVCSEEEDRLFYRQPGSVEIDDEWETEPKVNERKPMVFMGGISASTSPMDLVMELKKQDFNVTVVPRIRYGVSFGFCPDLVVSTIEEVKRLLAIRRIWIKDRWCDVRPYVAKEDKMDITSPSSSSSRTSDTAESHHSHMTLNSTQYSSMAASMQSVSQCPSPQLCSMQFLPLQQNMVHPMQYVPQYVPQMFMTPDMQHMGSEPATPVNFQCVSSEMLNEPYATR